MSRSVNCSRSYQKPIRATGLAGPPASPAPYIKMELNSMSNNMSEDEKRQTEKAFSGKYRYFDPSVFTEDNLKKLKAISRRQGNTELRELLTREEMRRN